MVGLDDCRLAETTLDDIGINGTLYQIIYGTDFLGFFLENTDEFFANDLTLLFRFSDTGQLAVEAFLSVDTDKLQELNNIYTRTYYNYSAPSCQNFFLKKDNNFRTICRKRSSLPA